MNKQIIDEDSEIAYKWSKRFARDSGKGSDSRGYVGNYENKPKAKYLRRPFNRNISIFNPARYCMGCQHEHCGLVLLRRSSYYLGFTMICGIIKACK